MIYEIPLLDVPSKTKPGEMTKERDLEAHNRVVRCHPDRKFWPEWIEERYFLFDVGGPESDLLWFYRSMLGFHTWFEPGKGAVINLMVSTILADELKTRIKRVLGWKPGQIIFLNPETPEQEAKLKALEARVPLSDPTPEEIEVLRDEGIGLQWRLGTFEDLKAGDPYKAQEDLSKTWSSVVES